MANLLAKFRIDFSDVIVIADVAKKASEPSRNAFEELIKDFKSTSEEDSKENEGQLFVLKFNLFINIDDSET